MARAKRLAALESGESGGVGYGGSRTSPGKRSRKSAEDCLKKISRREAKQRSRVMRRVAKALQGKIERESREEQGGSAAAAVAISGGDRNGIDVLPSRTREEQRLDEERIVEMKMQKWRKKCYRRAKARGLLDDYDASGCENSNAVAEDPRVGRHPGRASLGRNVGEVGRPWAGWGPGTTSSVAGIFLNTGIASSTGASCWPFVYNASLRHSMPVKGKGREKGLSSAAGGGDGCNASTVSLNLEKGEEACRHAGKSFEAPWMTGLVDRASTHRAARESLNEGDSGCSEPGKPGESGNQPLDLSGSDEGAGGKQHGGSAMRLCGKKSEVRDCPAAGDGDGDGASAGGGSPWTDGIGATRGDRGARRSSSGNPDEASRGQDRRKNGGGEDGAAAAELRRRREEEAGDGLSDLHHELVRFEEYVSLTPAEVAARQQLVASIEALAIQALGARATARAFGSYGELPDGGTSNSDERRCFSIFLSDVDISVRPPPPDQETSPLPLSPEFSDKWRASGSLLKHLPRPSSGVFEEGSSSASSSDCDSDGVSRGGSGRASGVRAGKSQEPVLQTPSQSAATAAAVERVTSVASSGSETDPVKVKTLPFSRPAAQEFRSKSRKRLPQGSLPEGLGGSPSRKKAKSLFSFSSFRPDATAAEASISPTACAEIDVKGVNGTSSTTSGGGGIEGGRAGRGRSPVTRSVVRDGEGGVGCGDGDDVDGGEGRLQAIFKPEGGGWAFSKHGWKEVEKEEREYVDDDAEGRSVSKSLLGADGCVSLEGETFSQLSQRLSAESEHTARVTAEAARLAAKISSSSQARGGVKGPPTFRPLSDHGESMGDAIGREVLEHPEEARQAEALMALVREQERGDCSGGSLPPASLGKAAQGQGLGGARTSEEGSRAARLKAALTVAARAAAKRGKLPTSTAFPPGGALEVRSRPGLANGRGWTGFGGAPWRGSKPDGKAQALSGLRKLGKQLRKMPWVKKYDFRSRAKVPIIAMLDARTGVECDVGWAGGGTGGDCWEDPADAPGPAHFDRMFPGTFRPLALFLKVFMRQRDLDKPFTGGVGSFKLYALIASHLEASGCGSGRASRKRQDLGDLLLGFLRRYSKGSKTSITQETVVHVGGLTVDLGSAFRARAAARDFGLAFEALSSAITEEGAGCTTVGDGIGREDTTVTFCSSRRGGSEDATGGDGGESNGHRNGGGGGNNSTGGEGNTGTSGAGSTKRRRRSRAAMSNKDGSAVSNAGYSQSSLRPARRRSSILGRVIWGCDLRLERESRLAAATSAKTSPRPRDPQPRWQVPTAAPCPIGAGADQYKTPEGRSQVYRGEGGGGSPVSGDGVVQHVGGGDRNNEPRQLHPPGEQTKANKTRERQVKRAATWKNERASRKKARKAHDLVTDSTAQVGGGSGGSGGGGGNGNPHVSSAEQSSGRKKKKKKKKKSEGCHDVGQGHSWWW